ncbi:hypothetical protein PR048_005036 [Dryococelus australis]|uniref:RRM domain-containing protein n=1 Tax=Dryococelus australis TaxID=614101 RepID=A0ABQ9I730_9NEOP|nr:hypothetical protein PR048_005036 [Dryococelus australis]
MRILFTNKYLESLNYTVPNEGSVFSRGMSADVELLVEGVPKDFNVTNVYNVFRSATDLVEVRLTKNKSTPARKFAFLKFHSNIGADETAVLFGKLEQTHLTILSSTSDPKQHLKFTEVWLARRPAQLSADLLARVERRHMAVQQHPYFWYITMWYFVRKHIADAMHLPSIELLQHYLDHHVGTGGLYRDPTALLIFLRRLVCLRQGKNIQQRGSRPLVLRSFEEKFRPRLNRGVGGPIRAQYGEDGAASKCKGWENRENLEKICQPAALFSKIPICENLYRTTLHDGVRYPSRYERYTWNRQHVHKGTFILQHRCWHMDACAGTSILTGSCDNRHDMITPQPRCWHMDTRSGRSLFV